MKMKCENCEPEFDEDFKPKPYVPKKMFIKKECIRCGRIMKFLTGTPREKESICGECWNWDG